MAEPATPAEAQPAPETATAPPEPEVSAPEVVAPDVAAPAAKPEVVETEAAETTTEPEVVPPAAEPEVVASAAEPEVVAPTGKPEVVAPAAESEVAAPTIESKATTIVVVPEVESKDSGNTSGTMHKPKYEPMLAHNVRKPISYSRTVIADQELLLSNLSRMRRELDKDDRELSIMAKTLFNHNPKKWTPPNRYRFDRYDD